MFCHPASYNINLCSTWRTSRGIFMHLSYSHASFRTPSCLWLLKLSRRNHPQKLALGPIAPLHKYLRSVSPCVTYSTPTPFNIYTVIVATFCDHGRTHRRLRDAKLARSTPPIWASYSTTARRVPAKLSQCAATRMESKSKSKATICQGKRHATAAN